ncbi:hypothetical protein [Neoroseomonas lacus]|uniref:Uncharacterized protein n=1 Tax=Neoroseomonas lacus TaxID=287609 RepID=A0A917K685_9PROT|nr:hypothetical protein [Neoroseomonas lacus]GGJ00592.1 hypothetical protein GCM10011320_04280 [Neoroseomonas lacus]
MALLHTLARCAPSWARQAAWLAEIKPGAFARLSGADERSLQLSTAWARLQAVELFLATQNVPDALKAAAAALDVLRTMPAPPATAVALTIGLTAAAGVSLVRPEGFKVLDDVLSSNSLPNNFAALQNAAGLLLAATLAASPDIRGHELLLETPPPPSDNSVAAKLRHALGACAEAAVLPHFGLRRMPGNRFEPMGLHLTYSDWPPEMPVDEGWSDPAQKAGATAFLHARGTAFEQRLTGLAARLREPEDIGDGHLPFQPAPPFGGLIDWPFLLLLVAHYRSLSDELPRWSGETSLTLRRLAAEIVRGSRERR